MVLHFLPSLVLFLFPSCTRSVDTWQDPEAVAPRPEGERLGLELVSDDFDTPVYLCSAPADATTLFVLEKEGRLRVLEQGTPRAEDLIDLTAKINDKSERGLLGMAWHPTFPEKPLVYLHYSDLEGSTVIASFRVDPKTWIADPASEVVLLHLEQPWANHNGGMIEFGPRDGYLYIGLGDGGAANDPNDAGQNGQDLLGKILRIDVDRTEGDLGYGIPEDNPFVGDEAFRDEIWAYGARNPWRFCFDPVTNDLFIGDVGQNKWEEIHWAPGSSKGGENYGWRLKEGTHEFKESEHAHDHPLVEPIHEYGRKGGHCSVTGGFVYRGGSMPWLQGHSSQSDRGTAG
ncbi:MAG: PQQ-dependent sugar dehydrogenase [Planctomycetota bacterium]|jgi:glucose/arabinose dehydrogenase